MNVRGTEFCEVFVTVSGTGAAMADLTTSKQPAINKRLEILGVYSKPVTYAS
jgi:hypothetical protein